MRIIDSHFHWWPRSYWEALTKRKTYPRAERDGKGGYVWYRQQGVISRWLATGGGTQWIELDRLFEKFDALGRGTIDVFGSVGPLAVTFSMLPASEGRELAIQWNEETAAAMKRHSDRFVGAAAAVPLVDTAVALDVLEDAVGRLGLRGVSLPGSVGYDSRIDHERLEPFYDRVEELGIPLFLHPTDAVFVEMLDDAYGGALYRSLGRVIEVSVCAMRLIFSGIVERHPNLKVMMSHTGGALPYQAGRLDKNGTAAKLPELPSTYLKRFYTDTVSPHSLGMRFAVEFFGADHVLYGSDDPCWKATEALRLFDEAGFAPEIREQILSVNARRVLPLNEPAREVVGAS